MPDKKFREGFIEASVGTGRSENNSFPCPLPKVGASWFLIWSKGSVHRSGRKGSLSVLSNLSVVLSVEAMHSTLLFRSVSRVFLYLFCPICPNYASIQLFLVSYSFFVFCCSRRCLSRCKHYVTAAKVPGPTLFHS